MLNGLASTMADNHRKTTSYHSSCMPAIGQQSNVIALSDGIPAKFVIDKNGRFRFKAADYSGSSVGSCKRCRR